MKFWTYYKYSLLSSLLNLAVFLVLGALLAPLVAGLAPAPALPPPPKPAPVPARPTSRKR